MKNSPWLHHTSSISKGAMHASLAIGQPACIPPRTLLGVRCAQRRPFMHSFSWKFLPVSHKIRTLTLLLFVLEIHWRKMPVTWREREHEGEDMLALHDPVTVNALRNCGLFKFLRISSMRQQIKLLQYLLDAWDPTS